MAKRNDAASGFLTRLLHNKTANVLPMTAAAVIPLIGMIGGAVDMARIYAVRSRLQAACDAGALAGRRVMGTGQWTDNSGRANTTALNAFDINFKNGAFGSQNLVRTFAENNATVTGTASADVPMTLMRVLGIPTKSVAVTCDGMMRIPNTDVMFVLDNSGSMAFTIPGDPSGLSRMAGLRIAVKCFYEALAKLDISDVTPSQCGTSSNPSGGLSSQVQLRFGFVNYDNMVNVGKLLKHEWMVDDWTYQSREPHYANVWAWAAGSESAIDWGDWSPVSTPSSYQNASNYGSFNALGKTGSTMVGGVNKPHQATPANSTTCSAYNTYTGSQLAGINESSSSGSIVPTTTAPNYPDATQTIDNNQTNTVTVTGYRYRWFKQGGTNGCWLERATADNTYSQTRTGTSTKPLSWTQHQTLDYWTYHPVQLPVSGLKASGGNWNSSISLPLNQTNGTSVRLSGSTSSTTLKVASNTSVAWDGCIEERDTTPNSDGNPSDDWLNYPSSPANAYDMDIDLVPTDNETRWRPILVGAVWGRRGTLSSTGSWSGNYTNNPITSTYSGIPSRNLSSYTTCVTASRKLQAYSNATAADDFRDYVNTISPNGNTYHDIGLLWGARLMSPTGIFASENLNTPGGASIQRHMIFMTDGDTANTWNNYASYGLEWWDRRQVTPAGATSTDLDNFEVLLQNNNNARSSALCTAIKNKGITLWVISYGDAVNTTTINRLTACATSPTYFFSAANTTQLISKFREIADKISQLRLTK